MTSGISANAIVQLRTPNGQVLNPNTLGLSERGLRRAMPPTAISYAEFVGMRPRTMSQMFFRTEDGKVSIHRDDKEVGEPHKGTGRSNYRAFERKTLKSLAESQNRDRAIELDEDPTKIVVTIPVDKVPVHPSNKGKGPNLKREKGEQDTVENKRAKLGGPACMPAKWRNMGPGKMFMSFDMPDFKDSTTMVFFQANSQLPAFGRYFLDCSVEERPLEVLDNPMGSEGLWAPQTASPWGVCFRDGEYKFDFAGKHADCPFCQGARAGELLPCC